MPAPEEHQESDGIRENTQTRHRRMIRDLWQDLSNAECQAHLNDGHTLQTEAVRSEMFRLSERVLPTTSRTPSGHHDFNGWIGELAELLSLDTNEVLEIVARYRDASFCSNCGMCVCSPYETAYQEDPICNSCVDHSYRWSDVEEAFVSLDDTEDYDREDQNGVYSYDANPLNYLPNMILSNRERKRNLKKNHHPVLLGVELEVERKESCDSAAASSLAHEVFAWCILKADGTLSNGFEIVSAPASFEWHKCGYEAGTPNAVSPWRKLLSSSLIRDNFTSWNTGTCGVHVHVSRAALTPLQIGKIMVFMNAYVNYDIISRIAGRGSTEYAKHQTDTDIFYHLKKKTRSDRYVWVNLTKRGTIEFRLFRGNTKWDSFLRYLEFTQATVEFTAEASIRHLHIRNFCAFLERRENHSRFNFLYEFLVERWPHYFTGNQRNNMNKNKKPGRIDDDMILTTKAYKSKIPTTDPTKAAIVRLWPDQFDQERRTQLSVS